MFRSATRNSSRQYRPFHEPACKAASRAHETSIAAITASLEAGAKLEEIQSFVVS
jgi:hypothetical protein